MKLKSNFKRAVAAVIPPMRATRSVDLALDDACDLLSALISDTQRHAKDETEPKRVRTLATEELEHLFQLQRILVQASLISVKQQRTKP